MKPCVLLSTRVDVRAADDEYAAFLRFTGLAHDQLLRVRLTDEALGHLDLDALSGVLLGGGPFNSSDPLSVKSVVQQRVEADLRRLLDEVVERDFPFLGACYGIGTLGVHQGGVVDRTYAEPLGAVDVTLTDEGAADPLLAGMPRLFSAFVGHKEACTTLPAGAVLLAGSPACPVQMFRLRRNLYATQFHPELDVEGLVLRAQIYRDAGYFDPAELDELIERVRRTDVRFPPQLLVTFVARYGDDG